MKGPEFARTHIIEEGVGNSITNSVQSFMKQQPIKASTELIKPDRYAKLSNNKSLVNKFLNTFQFRTIDPNAFWG